MALKTRQQLKDAIDALFVENENFAISAAQVNALMQDVVDSLGLSGTDTITDAVTAHSLNATYSHTEVEGKLNALGVVINNIIDKLVAAGIISDNV